LARWCRPARGPAAALAYFRALAFGGRHLSSITRQLTRRPLS
jgi:hypothetical protein